MVVIGRADEAVIADVHQLPQILDALGALDDVINKLLRGDAGLLGLQLDLWPCSSVPVRNLTL